MNLEVDTIQPMTLAFTPMLGKYNLILGILGRYTVEYPVKN